MAPVAGLIFDTRMTDTARTRLTPSGVATRNAPSAGPIKCLGRLSFAGHGCTRYRFPIGGKPRPYASIKPAGWFASLAGRRVFYGGFPNAYRADGP
jgi:hypothetical protein